MSTPFDNFNKIYQSLEKSLRITESLSSAMPNFYSALSAVNSSAIITATKALTSPNLISSFEQLNHSGIIAAVNSLSSSIAAQTANCLAGSTLLLDAMSRYTSVSQNVLDATVLAQNLAKQLTIPPVYSISPLAYDVKVSMVDCENGELTSRFKDFVEKISTLPIEDLEYAQIDDEIEISPAMSEIISASFPESVNNCCSRKKFRISKEFVSKILIPLLAFAIPFAYEIYSNHQSSITLNKILINQQKQTEYMRQISESHKSCECNEYIDPADCEQEHHYPEK